MGDRLEAVISLWLSDELSVTTVVGAEEALLRGPVGHFGLLESLVLERTGQADLAVEATPLAEADDSPESGGDPTLFLSLLGERFGMWLLYRRQVKVLKATRKDAPPPKECTCSVQVAESAEALMAQCGLSPAEKRLFQQAGCLPHATLWPEVEHTASNGLLRGSGQPEPLSPDSRHTGFDLSSVPDRQRQHLQALLRLVVQGKLDSHDTDLLLKTARHLARGRNSVKPATPTVMPATKRR